MTRLPLRSACPVAVAALVLCVVSAAHAVAETATPESGLRAVYERVDADLSALRVAELQALETGDFTATTADGRVQQKVPADAAFAAALQSLAKLGKITRATTTVGKIEPQPGGQMLVEAVQQLTVAVADQAGGSHVVVATSESRDTWVHTPPGWRLQATVEIRSGLTLDGKPVAP